MINTRSGRDKDVSFMIGYQIRYRKKLTLRGFIVVEESLVEELYSTGFEMESYWVWRMVPTL